MIEYWLTAKNRDGSNNYIGFSRKQFYYYYGSEADVEIIKRKKTAVGRTETYFKSKGVA